MSDIARAAGGVGGADLGRRPNQSRPSDPAAPAKLMLAYDHDEDSAVDEGDRIPLSGESHRGVPLHAGQSRARLEVVRRDIDRAYELDPAELLDFAENVANAPEARRSEEHTSELQSLRHLVCRLLLEKKNKKY